MNTNNSNSTSRWQWRFAATLSVFFIALFLNSTYSYIRPAVDGAAAAQQVNGGTGTLLKTQLTLNAVHLFNIASMAVVALIWIGYRHRKSTPSVGTTAILLVGASLLTGCGPARFDKFIEIGPNETAFVIPLTGDTSGNQVKFNSVEYLNTKKVAAKRVSVPLVERNTGRMWFDYEYIDGIRVFKVNRSLVSREWTSGVTGTNAKNEGIPVVTKDGIQLSLGVAITVFVEEEDAATFLYYHGEQILSQVTDSNIRNYCISELTREYGSMDLQEAKTNGPTIFAKLFTDAKAYFKGKGISVQQLGNAEGYTFSNPVIQEAINRRFTAEQDIATATQEKLAQDQRNFKLLATAETSAAAAKKIYEAKEATTLQNQLEIATMRAKAAITMAEKWNGQMPANILPSDSPILLNMGTSPASAPAK